MTNDKTVRPAASRCISPVRSRTVEGARGGYQPRQLWSRAAMGVLAAAALVHMPSASATERALILSIGSYSDPSADLPGMNEDAQMAKRIAQSMGVQPANITQYADAELTKQGISQAFTRFAQQVQPGDGVFVYYSGHGGQIVANKATKKCTSGMVAQDLQLFDDEALQQALQSVAEKAGRVVMMNDSCFSGGAVASKALPATKALTKTTTSLAKKPKSIVLTADEDPEYVCGRAVNMKAARNLFAEPRPANMLYIAAASDREVSYATPNGSLATQAWAQCLSTSSRNQSGLITGEDIRVCAQRNMDQQGYHQTITLVGNSQLPIGFSDLASGTTAPTTGTNPGNSGELAVNAASTLNAIRQGASSAIRVDLRVASPRMRISTPAQSGDVLDFSVTTDTPGYLYVLHVGSDGKTFDLLYPNDQDKDNRVSPGTVRLPKPNWAVRAGGPAGTSYLMAVVTEAPRKFVGALDSKEGPFAVAPANNRSSRNLYSEAVGAGQNNPGRFGASGIVPIAEIN